MTYRRLVCRALWELARFDIVYARGGFARIEREFAAAVPLRRTTDPALERTICDAVSTAACLYWRPALCLQRSVAAARLLRSHGIPARLIIGYRPVPFLSHAWVEVDSRVVNDSSRYQKQLRVLQAL